MYDMKKSLLLSTFIGIAMIISAQTPMQKQNSRLSQETKLRTKAITEVVANPGGEVNPYVANPKNPDIVVGITRYDLQSNSSMARRIHAHPDGTIGATWTYGMSDPSFPERGTGYNYFNGSTWGPYPTARIEPVRNGWSTYQPYGPNGEIVVAHTGGTAGLIFSHRPNKGTGAWTHFYLQGPAGFQDLLWPRMITSGPTRSVIHVIAALNANYQGLDGALLYSRSSDGGQTWNPQNVILPGLGPGEIWGVGGDVYAWAAPMGDTIAFIVGDFLADGIVLKSNDGGDTWESMKYYEAPIPAFGNQVPLPRHGGIDGYQAAVIDDQGRVHVAVGRMMHSADGSGGPTSYFPYSNGLLYWNETLPPLDSTKVTSNILDPSGVPSQYLLAEVVDNGTDSIVGVATFQASLTSMPQLVFDQNAKILYAFYSALTLGFSNGENNYRHVWMRFSEDYGQTWSPPQDLTGSIFQIFSDCVYPSASESVTDKVHVLYQSDNQPGNAIRFSGHGVNDNNIVYLPVNLAVGINEKPASIIGIDQLMPNPANRFTRLVMHIDRPASAEVSMINLVGQIVQNHTLNLPNAGPHDLRLDLNGLRPGVYLVRVKAGNDVAVRKLVIE
jgi:hypothetical protein